VRGNYDAAFVNGVEVLLSQNNIKYFFSPYKYTNRNRVVYRAIRTIRDMFFNIGLQVSLFNVELMQKVIHFYNNSIHRSLFNRFTANQAQNNYIIVRTYIQEKNRQLEKAKKASLNYYPEYTPGNILLVNVPNKDRLKIKRRRNYDMLAYFMKYIRGNVEVMLMNTRQVLVLPLYCTKFLVKSEENLNDTARRMFLNSK
jgi:hypothetical protein